MNVRSPMLAFLRRAVAWMHGHPRLALVVWLTLFVQLVRRVSAAFLYGVVFDRGIGAGDGRALAFALTGLVVLVGAFAVASFVQEAAMSRLGVTSVNSVRERLFRRYLAAAPSFHSRHSPSELVDRMGSDADAVELALVRAVPPLLMNGGVIVIAAALLFAIEWRLALLVVALLPASMLASKPFQKQAAAGSRAVSAAGGELLALTQQASTGYLPLFLFRAQPLFVARFVERLPAFGKLAAGSHFHSGAAARAVEVTSGATELLVIGAGAWLVYRGDLSVGLLIAFISLLMNISYSVARLSTVLPIATRGVHAASRIDQLLGGGELLEDPPDARPLPEACGEVRFERVSFAYDGAPTLEDVTFSVPAGSAVAVVGPSGSGKSTLLSLLMRLERPDAGRIFIGDVPLQQATEASLRASIAVVPQSTILFQGSIRDNLAIARPQATDREVEAAARMAGAHDFIACLPGGYDAEVGSGGSRLSGGQRQRVAVARAFLRDAPIVLFDEPTSALDVAAEAAVGRSIAGLRGRRTVLLVTHRIGELSGFDRILVFDRGRLVQQGTHAELVGRAGPFRNLWSQVQGLHERGAHSATIAPERLRRFAFLEESRADTLAELSRSFLSERLPEDRVVFRQGDPGDRFYVIVRGTVEVAIEEGDGRSRRTRVLRDGECFGELALLGDAPRSATIRTLTDCTFLTLHRAQFLDLVGRDEGLKTKLDAVAAMRGAPVTMGGHA